jgi:hypothetical protein
VPLPFDSYPQHEEIEFKQFFFKTIQFFWGYILRAFKLSNRIIDSSQRGYLRPSLKNTAGGFSFKTVRGSHIFLLWTCQPNAEKAITGCL